MITASGRVMGQGESAPPRAAKGFLIPGFQIFPATVWQSVFATSFALSRSNP
jgi:hypothetical protein